MTPPTLSAIINTYNYGALVGRAIDSVLAQDVGGVEVIVVDDGSTDGSREVLERYRGRVRLVFQANAGQAAAMNAGVRESSGEVLCFLDADDWWGPGKLFAVRAAFEAEPRASLVYHRLQPMLSEDEPTMKPIPRTLCSGDLAPRLGRSAGWWPFPMTSAVSVRRSVWDEVGEIPAVFRISADAWLVGIYPFLGTVGALPETLGFYRIHGNNNWTRSHVDAAMLRKRMDHWQTTVRLTNAFLSARGSPTVLDMKDHFPWHHAAARLSGADLPRRAGLVLQGLRFGGEPNPARRIRDALRVLSDLRDQALPDGALPDGAQPDADAVEGR